MSFSPRGAASRGGPSGGRTAACAHNGRTAAFYDRGGTTRQDGTAIPSSYPGFVQAAGRRRTIAYSADIAPGSATLGILAGGGAVRPDHVFEAIQYRVLDRQLRI